MTMMSARTIWNAIGNRQLTVEGSRKENPRSIQYEIMTPNTMSVPSIITIWPRRCDFEVSDCHVGTVEVFIPYERQHRKSHVLGVIVTIAESSDETGCDKLAETERGTLDGCSNNHNHGSNENGLLTTQHVAFPLLANCCSPSFFRHSPSHMVATAPKKHPSVYPPTVMPW